MAYRAICCLAVFSAVLLSACSAQVPTGVLFDKGVHARQSEQAVLILYRDPSTPRFDYHHVMVGNSSYHAGKTLGHQSFATLHLPPGEYQLLVESNYKRGSTHDYETLMSRLRSPEQWPAYSRRLFAHMDLNLSQESISYVRLGMKPKTVHVECAETETVIKVCERLMPHLVIEQSSEDAALVVLPDAYEAVQP